MYPQEVLENILHKAENNSIFICGLKKIPTHKFKFIISWSGKPGGGVSRIDSSGRRNIVREMLQKKMILGYNARYVTLCKSEITKK